MWRKPCLCTFLSNLRMNIFFDIFKLFSISFFYKFRPFSQPHPFPYDSLYFHQALTILPIPIHWTISTPPHHNSRVGTGKFMKNGFSILNFLTQYFKDFILCWWIDFLHFQIKICHRPPPPPLISFSTIKIIFLIFIFLCFPWFFFWNY